MELIKIDTDHYVVVDDSEIKEGDWMYLQQGNTPSTKLGEIARCEFADANNLGVIWKKITHSNIGHLYQDSILPLSLQEVKELLGEVDVEKKAEEYSDFSNDYVPLTFGYKFNTNTKRDYLAGYAQAIEDNKAKRYTENDLRYMFECGRNYQNNAEITFKVSIEYLIQTKTSWQVEIVDGKLKLK